MYPILFKIGSLPIYIYNVLLSIAFLIGLYLVIKGAKKEGISKGKILVLSIYLIIFCQLGAKFFSLIFEQSGLFKSGSIYYGGIITGIIITIWYCYKEKLSFWNIVDIYAPSIAIGQAIGKIGCFLNGCCYGEIFFIPTQIFESFTSLTIFLILLRISKNQFLLYLILYGTSRVIVEIFRQDYRGEIIFNLFTISQFISILSIISASVILKIKMSFRSDSSFVIANPVVSLRTGSSEAISKHAISYSVSHINEVIGNHKYSLVIILLLVTIFCSGNQCQCPPVKRIPPPPATGSSLLYYINVAGNEIKNRFDALHVSKFVTDVYNFGTPDSDDFRITIVSDSVTGSYIEGKLQNNSIPFYNSEYYKLENILLWKVAGTNTFNSEFIRLVSDDVDKLAKSSRTLLLTLGSSVILSSPSLGNETKEIRVGGNYIKRVKLHIVILNETIDGKAVIERSEVEKDVRIANERFAQADIMFVPEIETKNPPLGVNLGKDATGFNGFSISIDTLQLPDLTDEEKALFRSDLKTSSTDDIEVYYVNRIRTPDGIDNKAGISYPAVLGKSSEVTNSIIIDVGFKGIDFSNAPFTLAHEIMHILLNSGHKGRMPDTNLFSSPTSMYNRVDATKRINKDQAEIMRESPLFD